jgi:putative ABC transport system permease protein
MKSYDAIELAGRNLRESALRNSLTTMGIAVGVASLVAMLSLGVGLQQLATRRLSRSGLFDTVVVFQQRDEFGTARRPQPETPNINARPVDDNALHEIEKLPGVVEAYPDLRFTTEVRVPPETAAAIGNVPANNATIPRPHFSGVSALPPSAGQNESFEKMQGTFFTGPSADEVILQADLAKELSADPAKLIGQPIVLRYAGHEKREGTPAKPGNADITDAFDVVAHEKKVRVVGIIETEPFGGLRGFGRNTRVFIPLQLGETLHPFQPTDLRDVMRGSQSATYAALTVRLGNPKDVERIEAAIKKMGFATFSLLDATRNLRRFFAILDLFLGIFGSLALAVASLGIINTLVMAILERRREIGIMKAIGASDGDVRGLFFAEAGAMGALGGAFGVLLGWGIGRVINFGTNIYMQRQQLPSEEIWSVPWWLVLGAITFAVVVSLLSGLYPAARAAKLDPVQALRYE